MAKPHEFEALFPVPLEPLNVRGAYTTAALPPEVDPALASLWRHLGVRLPAGAMRIIPHVAPGRVGRKGPYLSSDSSSPNWSGCVVDAQSGAPPFPVVDRQPTGHIDGYATPYNAQQHINYIDGQGNVVELLFRNDWAVNNLTSLAVPTPPPAGLGSAVAGYITTPPDQQHVVFIGQDAQIHELMFDGSWHHTNLCVASGHPVLTVLTAPTSLPLAAYFTSFNEQQHVIFLGTDGRPYELVYKSSAWQLTDLLGSATPALPVTVASDTPLVGYQTSWNGQHHVLFVGTTATSGRHIYELMFDTAWHLNDLTGTATGSPQDVIAGGTLCGYVTSANTQQHVDYVGVDGLVHELLYLPGAAHWHDTDLIGAANAETKLLVAATTSLVGYETSWNGQQHVCFVGIAEGNTTYSVFELMYPSGGTWTFNNLTSTVGGTAPLLTSPLDAYVTVTIAATGASFQQHVNFIG